MSETVVQLNPSAGAVKPLASAESIAADNAARKASVVEAAIEKDKVSPPTGQQSTTETKALQNETSEDKLSPEHQRFQQLVQKERKLVEQQRAMRAEIEKTRARERATQARLEALEKRLKEAPLQVLDERGVSYNDLTQTVLNDGKPAPELQIKALRDELENYKAAQTKEIARRQEMARQATIAEQQAAIQEFNEEVADFVRNNSEAYELTNLHNGYGLVAQTIEAYFKQTGKVMSPKEAADQVESYLEQAVEKSIATKKWKQRSTPKEEKTVAPGQQSRTLTNDMTASTATVINAPISEKERIRRAMAALETK